MDKSLINTNRKWHQNVMNLLLGKNVCGVCLNLNDDLVEWDNTFVFEHDDLNVESSLKNIMASAFTTTILDNISTTKFCQKCIDEIIRTFIFIHKIQENCYHITKIITEISHQMKWTEYLDETGSLSDIKDNLVNTSENEHSNAKTEHETPTEKNNFIDQTKNTRRIFLNDESLKTTLLQDPEMHRFLSKNEENKEIKLPAEITVKKVLKISDMKDFVPHELFECNRSEDTDYESIIPNIIVSKNENSSNEMSNKGINAKNYLSVKLVNGSDVIHSSVDNMDIVPEDLLELTWPEDDIGIAEHGTKIPVKKLNFNEALTVKFIPSQNTNTCQEMDSEIAPHELLELSWNEDSDVENSSLETIQKHNIDLTKWLQDQGMSTIKPNSFDKGETAEIPQIEKLSETYNEIGDCQHIEVSPMFTVNKETEDILRCALCSSIFEQFETYKIHYKRHKITEIAKCHRCSSDFTTIELLLEHLLQIHSENVACCNFCFAVLSQEKLTHHMSTYHEAEVKTINTPGEKAATVLNSKSSYCMICKQPFDESTRDSHVCIESDARCSECKNACIHERYLSSYRNQLKSKKRMFKCTDCKFKYKNKCDIVKHANRVHLKYRPYRCKVCNIGFSLKVSLGKHQNIYHARCGKCPRASMCKHKQNSVRCNVKCELCGQRFNYENKYKQHKESALLVTEECFVCQQIVPVKCNMVRHIEYVHNACLKKDGSESILYECLVCERLFNSAKEFYNHNWEHKGKINKKFLSTRSRTKIN